MRCAARVAYVIRRGVAERRWSKSGNERAVATARRFRQQLAQISALDTRRPDAHASAIRATTPHGRAAFAFACAFLLPPLVGQQGREKPPVCVRTVYASVALDTIHQ